jgi:hypothetical protein
MEHANGFPASSRIYGILNEEWGRNQQGINGWLTRGCRKG